MWWRRADGKLAKEVPLTRRVMPYLMKGRNESAVYTEQDISLQRADAFIRAFNQANPATPIDPFHLAIHSLREVMRKYPEMNRFVAGGRIYQRDGIWFSYAIKTNLKEGAPTVVVKRRFDLDEPFEAMVAGMQGQIHEQRFGGPGHVEKELRLLMYFPGFVRRILIGAINLGDRLSMLPRSYVDKDPMFCTAFFANFASIGMGAAYHHLYEYGTCGIFAALGRPVSEPGSPTSGPDRRRVMNVRWTFDDRLGDGMVAALGLRRFKQNIEEPASMGLELPTPVVPPTDAHIGDAALP